MSCCTFKSRLCLPCMDKQLVSCSIHVLLQGLAGSLATVIMAKRSLACVLGSYSQGAAVTTGQALHMLTTWQTMLSSTLLNDGALAGGSMCLRRLCLLQMPAFMLCMWSCHMAMCCVPDCAAVHDMYCLGAP